MRRHAVAAAVLVLIAGCESEKGERPPPSYDLAARTPPRVAVPARERDCLAEAIYFEARGEQREGQIAIAHVVLNRAAAGGAPNRACDVIREGETLGKGRCQFHWRCDGAPDTPTDAAAWSAAQRLADGVLAGETADPTNGALYFHHTKVRPDWAGRLRRTAAIGSHIYYAK
jgi:spore germination cell wall hydrolase CwlJ-like protein